MPMPELNLSVKDNIIPMFDDVLEDIMEHKHTHYVFKGGRGSTKSSFISLVLPLLIINNSKIHATVFRKVGNTMKNSVWGQVVWGIHAWGLDNYFHIPKSIANPIVFLPTGQQIMFTV